jgi:hypothetical protein
MAETNERLRVGAAAVLLTGVTAVASCRQIVGIGDDPPTAVSNVCGLPYTGDCASCVSASCCNSASTCASDHSCRPYMSCIAGCNEDPTCVARCTAAATPLGDTTAMSQLLVCLATHCENECGLQCGLSGAIDTTPDAAATCKQCIDSHDCETFRACLQSAECSSVALCQLSCQARPDCLTGCGVNGASTPVLYQAAAQSYNGVCGQACAAGSNWECLGRIVAPYPRGSAVHVSMQINDPYTMTPQPLIQVAACAFGTCGPVVKETDGQGNVAFDFRVNPQISGPSGFVQLTSAPDAGAGSIVRERYYWGTPLAGPSVFFGTSAQTPSELDASYGAAGVTPLPMRASLGLSVRDCNGSPAPGIHFDLQGNLSGAQTVYLQNRQPSRSATTTDAEGLALVANVPSGPVTVTAFSVALNRPVSSVSIDVEADTLVWVDMPPLL